MTSGPLNYSAPLLDRINSLSFPFFSEKKWVSGKKKSMGLCTGGWAGSRDECPVLFSLMTGLSCLKSTSIEGGCLRAQGDADFA